MWKVFGIRKLILLLLVLGYIMLLIGCSTEDVDSEDIRTSGIYAEMDLNAISDDAVNIDVVLKAGGENSNTYVVLSSGDRLTAILNDSESVELTSNQKFGSEVHYLGSFSGNAAGTEGSIVKILFERTENDVSAVDSLVALPAIPTDITPDKDTFQRSSENLSISWNNFTSEKELELEVIGSCIQSKQFDVVDNGTFIINAGTLEDKRPENCVLTITMERTVNGTLDTDFGEGGYIQATQTRSIQINSSP